MKFINVVSTAILLAGAASASASPEAVDKLVLVNRGHSTVSEEKRAALAEQYAFDHPGDVERAIGRRGAQDRILTAKRSNKKCRSKTHKAAAKSYAASHKHSGSDSHQSHHQHESESKDNNGGSKHHQHHDHSSSSSSKPSSTSSSSQSKSTSSSSGNSHGSGKGLFGMLFSKSSCSEPNASDEHPNGSPSFLTCGISKSNHQSKWTPPDVKMSDVKMISADQAAKSDVFKPCAKYKSTFEQVSKDTGVPAVLLMSFALQESTCNAGLTGANGEIGISQITPDKCGGAPGGNCHDVYFNVKTAANYFKNTLNNQCNGNMLCAAGQYNGWQANKMTYASATNQQYGCMSQNNLDYLNQLLNGFCQGKSGYSGKFTTFGNIAHC